VKFFTFGKNRTVERPRNLGGFEKCDVKAIVLRGGVVVSMVSNFIVAPAALSAIRLRRRHSNEGLATVATQLEIGPWSVCFVFLVSLFRDRIVKR
jgi:hypothetical protein